MDEVIRGLEETWSSFIELASGLRSADWARPTPCEQWDVRQLVTHVGGGQGLFEGLPQPAPPPGWTTANTGIDALTAEGVAARDTWSPEEVLDELRRATTAQLDRLRDLDDEGWAAPSLGPPGIKTVADLARNRLLDGFIHLLDLRVALDRPLDIEREPAALAACIQQALDLSGWGAVKKAGLADGSRVRLDLSDPCSSCRDLVVESGRGRLAEPRDPPPHDRVDGTAPAYLLVVTARPEWADRVGGIRTTGPAARQLLDRFVIWA